MKKRTTIADIAHATNVSLMTVSRAINNKPGLSQELRQKILDTAAEMGYRPNKIARGLATHQTATVGLVVPSISNPFFAQIAQGVEDLAYENDYSVFLINTAEDLAREESALDSLWAQDIDGAILCSLRLPERRVLEHIERFPAVVLFNLELEKPQPNVVTISINDQRAATEAVQHLLELRRRQIAYIGGPENSFSNRRRLEGYRQALKTADLPFDPALVVQVTPDSNAGKEAAKALFTRRSAINAILAFNDIVAVGVLQACQESGKRVPEDIAVIGADDIPLATLIRPRLSTSGVNLVHIGRLCMRTLLEMFSGKTSSASYKIEPRLILRESG